VYCGAFTAGGLKVKVADGRLTILQEGRDRKYVRDVEQVTFSGAYATQIDQKVLYITERAVFELRHGLVTLVEIAPGVDLERDILAHMDFMPALAQPLKPMPEALFHPHWGGLRAHILAKALAPEPVLV
jgi:propionate CoA-transferase